MPIQPALTEANWNANGLTKRSTLEKVKNPKTRVSEALRAYAAVAGGGIEALPAKGAALKAIKTLLTAMKPMHKGNTKISVYCQSAGL